MSLRKQHERFPCTSTANQPNASKPNGSAEILPALSNEEPQKRLLERIETSDKNWKFSASDAAEREHWDKYMEAYENMIRNTATEKSPWYVVPADNKWFTRVVVAAAVVDTLASLDLKYPEIGKDKLKELAATKAALLKNSLRSLRSRKVLFKYY